MGISLPASSETALAQDTPTNASSNASGIMQNTTGVIDDAFDALKDSFGTLFGGN
jgi:hypothetical protein